MANPAPNPGIRHGRLSDRFRESCRSGRLIVNSGISRFEEIAKAGPAEEREYLQSMIRHKAAIVRWMEMEAAGDTDGFLDAINEQLHFPL